MIFSLCCVYLAFVITLYFLFVSQGPQGEPGPPGQQGTTGTQVKTDTVCKRMQFTTNNKLNECVILIPAGNVRTSRTHWTSRRKGKKSENGLYIDHNIFGLMHCVLVFITRM